KKTGKKISIQGSDVVGFDKSKVECFNCHKMGHFAKECRTPKSQDRGRRDNYRQGSKVEEQAPKALIATDRVGWDWSYMANDEEDHALVTDEEAPTEFALMANTSAESKVFDNSLCSRECKKNNDILNSKITDLTDKLFDAKNMIYHYKLGLAQVESRLVEHKDREIKYCEKIKGLEFRTESSNDYIEILKKELETLKKEREGVDGKLAGFLTASKDLDNLIESQRSNNNKEGLGYSVVPPPPPQIYSSPKKDLSWTGLLEFVDDTVTDYSRPSPTMKSPNFVMKKKECFNCGHFDHLSYDCRKRVKKGTSRSQNNTHETFTPRPVIHRTYRPPVKPMRTNMNVRSQFRAPWVPTANKNFPPVSRKFSTVSRNFPTDNRKFPTANKKISTGGTKFSTADMGKKGKAVKSSACWFWKPSHNLSNKGPNNNSVSVMFKKYTYIDTQDKLKRVEENLHVEFLENKAIEKGAGPNWLFDIDSLTKSMNYVSVDAGIISTNNSGTKDATSQEVKKDVSSLRYIALPNWAHDTLLESSSSKPQDHCSTEVLKSNGNTNPTASTSNPPADQMETLTVESPIPTVSSPVPTACFTDSQEPSSDARLISKRFANQVKTPSLDNILTLTNRFEDILGGTTNSDESNGVEADVSNMETTITASPTPTLRIHKDHPKSQKISLVDTPIQTRNKSKEVGEQSFIATIHQKTDPALLQFCLFLCFLSQVEPKKISNALQDPSWVLKNKKDERGIVIRNKSRLVAQGHTREEGIDYDKVFAPVARIKAIRLFLAYASFMGFTVYQMDVKSAFLYGTIDEEVYVMQPPRFQDPEFPVRVYKVEKAMYRLHQAPRAWYGDILKKFGYSDVRSSNTSMDKENPWGKDRTGKDVDLHFYRSMIRYLMYLTASRPDIMFDVCACARHQVTPKKCHLHAVKRIFRYLKGHPKLGLWYPKESPFHLVAYSDSEYGGATQDRKSTPRGCQFLCRRLISWQCKKQTIVATLTTEAEYVAAASCCGQVLDYFEKKLINVDHIHTDGNVTDLLTKPFDAGRFQLSVPCEDLSREISSSILRLIAQPLVLLPVVDEPAYPLRDVSQGEDFPTDSSFIADQDRATIAKSSTLSHDSAPRVTSPAADEGSMQQTINKLTALCTSLQRQHSEMIAKFEAQEVEINWLKARVKLLEDREGVAAERSGDDAPIKGRNLDEGGAAAERVSDDIEEMVTVMTSMDAATVLASGVAGVATGSGSIPTASPPAAKVPTGSDVVPTANPVFATATVIDAQVAKELEEQLERENQRMSEQIARDAEVARIHVEEELQSMIDGLDRRNETVAKYLQKYQQFASELPLERRIELISDLVRYQDNYAKVHKFQTQQRKPWSKKQKRDYYMDVIRSNLVWKQLHDFVPIGSKEEAERFKRKGTRFEQESTKKLKTSEEVPEEVKSPDEVPEEKVKEMMQLVPIEEVYVEALQVKHPIIDWKVHTEVDWKFYDMCGVHQVTSKDKEFFMLVEKDYPLRKGLALLMICYKLQVENYSQMANDLILKIYKIANSPKTARNKIHKAFPLSVIEFPLAEEVPTASEESSHCQKKRMPLPRGLHY
nr:ribonuclease H-like domain-containing protein [Tanacetum cinerariifolium]